MSLNLTSSLENKRIACLKFVVAFRALGLWWVQVGSKISSVGYVNRIRDNLLRIKRRKLLPLYENLKSADCVVCSGSGRSLYSLNAAMSQIAMSKVGWRNKIVLTPLALSGSVTVTDTVLGSSYSGFAVVC